MSAPASRPALFVRALVSPGYAALYSFVISLVVSVLATIGVKAVSLVASPPDETSPEDYLEGGDR